MYLLAFLIILSIILPSVFSESFASVPTIEKIEKSSDASGSKVAAANTNSAVATSYVRKIINNSVANNSATPALYDSKIDGNSSSNFPAEIVGSPVHASDSIINLSAIISDSIINLAIPLPPPPAHSNPIAVDTKIELSSNNKYGLE